jgi:hypothetical protein
MSSARYIAPRSDVPRPPLPIEHANSQLLRSQFLVQLPCHPAHPPSVDPAKPLPVKFQEISRDGHVALVSDISQPARLILTSSIQVGRIKIPTVRN